MNEQLRQRAQEIATEHGNDAYSVALAMLEAKDENNELRKLTEKLIESERHSLDEIKAKSKKIAGLKTKIAMQSQTIKDVREDYSSLIGSINKIKAEAVREAKTAITSGAIENTHKYMIIEGRYCYVSNRALDEYASKLESMLGNKPHSCDDELCGGGNADTYPVKLDCGCVVTKNKLESRE